MLVDADGSATCCGACPQIMVGLPSASRTALFIGGSAAGALCVHGWALTAIAERD